MKRINGFLNIDSSFIKNYKKKYVNEFVKKVSDIHYIITIMVLYQKILKIKIVNMFMVKIFYLNILEVQDVWHI